MESSNPHDPAGGQHQTHSEHTDQLQSARQHSKTSEEIAQAYADVADKFARWQQLDRLFAGRYPRNQFEQANGRVLDVACGTGQNFRYLESAVEVVGIDISDAMLTHAREELDRLGLDGGVQQMDAQALEFPDNSFDTVISSFSTCTFPDPVSALHEMERVCAPDGEILLLEHSRSDVAPLAWLQDRRAESHYEKNGCRLNHEPRATVEAAGFPVESVSTAFFGLVTAIDASSR